MDCCIVIPAYRPSPALIGYAAELLAAQSGPVAVVDDGGGPTYNDIFDALADLPGCTVLRHLQNRGKGAAIKTAIRWYRNSGADLAGIITADCDGQHTVQDVLRLSAALAEAPDSLILGVRTFGPGTPPKSAAGNRTISKLLSVLYGIELEDTQTGLRALPNRLLPTLETLSGDRYEYELNMLLQANRMCVPFVTVPIETLYFDNNAGSHFRAVTDTLRIAALLGAGLAQYALSSAASAIVDVAFYGLLVKFVLDGLPFSTRLALAAAAARVISSIVNYTCNRKLPYVQNERIFPTLLRYYALWACQLAASISLVWVIHEWLGVDELWAKLIVDLGLAAASYQVQMRWVFRLDRSAGAAALQESPVER
ncbi:MAG: glycosyltransferase [Oscillospiraceae bacterium]|nr:glycosyltransferase [Oscillospiraceae bacterium]